MSEDPSFSRPRTWRSIDGLLSQWKGAGTERDDLRSAWRWLIEAGRDERIDVMGFPSKPSACRISMVFILAALHDEVLEVKETCSRADSSLDEYLSWENSDLGRLCFRMDRKIGERRARMNYRKMLKILETTAAGGGKSSMKAVETHLKATGKLDGSQDEPDGIHVTVIDTIVMKNNTPTPVAKTDITVESKSEVPVTEAQDLTLKLRDQTMGTA